MKGALTVPQTVFPSREQDAPGWFCFSCRGGAALPIIRVWSHTEPGALLTK